MGERGGGGRGAAGKVPPPHGFRFPHLFPLCLWVLYQLKFQEVLTKEKDIFFFFQEDGEGMVEGSAQKWASLEESRL